MKVFEPDTRDAPDLKPCPFCGETPTPPGCFQEVDGYKWGAVRCGCGATGPDTRTGYDQSADAPWHKDAAEEWNRRTPPEGLVDDN